MKDARRRIEAAALELFARVGVEGTTTRAIADRAGVAEGSLYRHFPTKDELAWSLFLSFSNRLLARLTEAVAAADNPVVQLRGIVDAFFWFAQEQPEACEYIVHRHPPMNGHAARLPKDVLVEVVQRGTDAGVFGGTPPVLGAALVVGMIVRALFFVRQGLLDMPVREVGDHVARAALRVLEVKS